MEWYSATIILAKKLWLVEIRWKIIDFGFLAKIIVAEYHSIHHRAAPKPVRSIPMSTICNVNSLIWSGFLHVSSRIDPPNENCNLASTRSEIWGIEYKIDRIYWSAVEKTVLNILFFQNTVENWYFVFPKKIVWRQNVFFWHKKDHFRVRKMIRFGAISFCQ